VAAATAAVGAGTAIVALAAAVAGGIAASAFRRGDEATMRYGGFAPERSPDEDQPTILPPTH
jgi:hypothetical protein